jgi:hypothetical protein
MQQFCSKSLTAWKRMPSNGTTTLVLPVVVISSYLWPKLLISMWLMSRGMEGEARIRQPMITSSKLRSAFPHQFEACNWPLDTFVTHRIVRSCSLTCTNFHNNRIKTEGRYLKLSDMAPSCGGCTYTEWGRGRRSSSSGQQCFQKSREAETNWGFSDTAVL